LLTSSVAVVPPEPIRRRIDEVRRRFDKVWAGFVLGHVSLMRPVRRQFNPKEVEQIRAALSGIQPFNARTRNMEALTSSEGLYLSLRVEPEEPFDKMHRAIAAIVGEEASFISFHPHITVGSFVNQDALARAYDEIKADFPSTRFPVDAAYLIVVDTEATPSPVKEVARFELAKT
jgi:2'-5' RNA ligase